MKTELISLSAIEIAEEISDFQSAITAASELLVTAGYVKASYVTEVLENFRSLGPYFAISPEVSIAHAKPSTSVLAPGLSLLKLAKPISTGNQLNPSTQLVFALATPDAAAHIELMADLAQKLSDTDVVNSLLIASAKSVIWEILNS